MDIFDLTTTTTGNEPNLINVDPKLDIINKRKRPINNLVNINRIEINDQSSFEINRNDLANSFNLGSITEINDIHLQSINVSNSVQPNHEKTKKIKNNSKGKITCKLKEEKSIIFDGLDNELVVGKLPRKEERELTKSRQMLAENLKKQADLRSEELKLKNSIKKLIKRIALLPNESPSLYPDKSLEVKESVNISETSNNFVNEILLEDTIVETITNNSSCPLWQLSTQGVSFNIIADSNRLNSTNAFTLIKSPVIKGVYDSAAIPNEFANHVNENNDILNKNLEVVENVSKQQLHASPVSTIDEAMISPNQVDNSSILTCIDDNSNLMNDKLIDNNPDDTNYTIACSIYDVDPL